MFWKCCSNSFAKMWEYHLSIRLIDRTQLWMCHINLSRLEWLQQMRHVFLQYSFDLFYWVCRFCISCCKLFSLSDLPMFWYIVVSQVSYYLYSVQLEWLAIVLVGCCCVTSVLLLTCCSVCETCCCSGRLLFCHECLTTYMLFSLWDMLLFW